MDKNSIYKQLNPSEALQTFVHSYWKHTNSSDEANTMSITPDSFFKIIFVVQNNEIIQYFMTGIWTEVKEFTIPPNSKIYGCRLKILAPEYLLEKSLAPLLNTFEQLPLTYLNLENFDLSSFEKVTEQLEKALLTIKSNQILSSNKLRLSELLYQKNGAISAKEVSEQIFWTNRQINRYLNKYLGISLKKYLNIQKIYHAYIQIQQGKFFPKSDYFDQAHFIREVKKHTGETPSELYKKQNDRFIQLKYIKPK